MATLLRVNNDYNLPNIGIAPNVAPPQQISIAPNVAPAQNISVPVYRGPGTYSWSTPPPPPSALSQVFNTLNRLGQSNYNPTNVVGNVLVKPLFNAAVQLSAGGGNVLYKHAVAPALHLPTKTSGGKKNLTLQNALAQSKSQAAKNISANIGNQNTKQQLGNALTIAATAIPGGSKLVDVAASKTASKVANPILSKATQKAIQYGGKGVMGAGTGYVFGGSQALAQSPNASLSDINKGGVSNAKVGAALGVGIPLAADFLPHPIKNTKATGQALSEFNKSPVGQKLNSIPIGLSTKDVSPISRLDQSRGNTIVNKVLPRAGKELRGTLIGGPSPSVIKAAKDAGLDVSQMKHEVTSTGIKHILDGHGESATLQPGELPITKEDLAKIPDIVHNPDTVNVAKSPTNRGLPALQYTKRYNGHTYYVEEVQSGRGKLTTKTMYKKITPPDTSSAIAAKGNVSPEGPRQPGSAAEGFGKNPNASSATIPKTGAKVNKPNVPEVPKKFYRGGADSEMPKNLTAHDVINYERNDLGNVDVKPVPGVNLKEVPSNKLMWVTGDRKSASEYGKVYETGLSNPKIVATDGQGGYLVDTRVTPPTQGVKAAIPAPEKPSVQKASPASSGPKPSAVSSGQRKQTVQPQRTAQPAPKLLETAKQTKLSTSSNNATKTDINQEPPDFLKAPEKPKFSPEQQTANILDTTKSKAKAVMESPKPPEEKPLVNNPLSTMPAPTRELPKAPKNVQDLPPLSEIPLRKYLLSNKVNAIRSIGGEHANELADRIVSTDKEARNLRADWMYKAKTALSLNNKDFSTAVDVVEGKTKLSAVSPKIQQAAKEMRTVFPDVYRKGSENGLIIGDRGKTYFPHSYPDLKKLKGSKYDQAIQYLMDTNQVDHQSAVSLFNNIANEGKYPNRFGNFANARLTDMPGYYKDKHAFTSYIQSAAQNIAEARNLGEDNQIAGKLLQNIRMTGGDVEAAQKAVENYLRDADKGRGAGTLRTIRSGFGAVRLGKAAISHAGQTSNTAVESGITRTLKGWGQFISRNPEHRDFIDKTGVINPQELHSYRNQYTSVKGVASKITAPGLTQMMKVNRSVTALAGRAFGQKLAEVGNVAKLRDLGVTGEIGSKLTPSQEIEAARGLVDHTMFSGSRATTPILAETPIGKVVGQYRTAYAYKQTGFIYNKVIQEARKGNLAPLARYLTLSAGIGLGTVAIKNKISGNKEGIGGMATDALAALGGLPGEALNELVRYGIGHKDMLGAVASEAAPLAGEVKSAADAIDKGGKGIERYVAKLSPFGGKQLANKVAPTKPAPVKTQVSQGAKQSQTGIYQVKAKDGTTKFATLQGKNLKTFSNLNDAKTAQAKNQFKYSNKTVTTINGQQYHKTPSGTVVKGAPPVPTSSTSTKTVYDAKTKTWTQTNPNTGKVVQISSDGTRTTVNNGLGTIRNARSDYVKNIQSSASKYGLDVPAVMAVAAAEGLGGGVGDNGTSFGPFQLHIGGALPQGKDQTWAESPQGIDYAVQQIAKLAKGKSGADAISAIVQGFEKPTDPNGEISRALAIYNGQNATLASGSPGGVKVASAKGTKSGSSSTSKTALKSALSTVLKAQKSASAAIKPPKAPAAPKFKTAYKSPLLKKQQVALSGFGKPTRISIKKNR